MKLTVKGGTIVTAQGQVRADLAVEDERVVAMAENVDPSGDTIDASGF